MFERQILGFKLNKCEWFRLDCRILDFNILLYVFKLILIISRVSVFISDALYSLNTLSRKHIILQLFFRVFHYSLCCIF